MYSFEEANIDLTEEQIFAKLSELDIFIRYIPSFKEIDKAFCSDLRGDKNPSCSIYISSTSHPRYKDYADGTNLNCTNYVQVKFGCTYHEALRIISNDFRLNNVKTNDQVSNTLRSVYSNNLNYSTPQKQRTVIQIVSQPFNIVDYDYWNQFNISLDLLTNYNVFSCKQVHYFKGTKRYIFNYSKSDPIYAYRFTEDGQYFYKIYRPMADKSGKWMFNGTRFCVEGYDQLDLSSKILILTKAMKDVMVYRVLGYDAISLQGEANKLEFDLLQKLYKRFDKILVNFDNDPTGITGMKRLKNDYNLDSFIIPESSGCKDLSDYIKKFGKEEAEKLIKILINAN